MAAHALQSKIETVMDYVQKTKRMLASKGIVTTDWMAERIAERVAKNETFIVWQCQGEWSMTEYPATFPCGGYVIRDGQIMRNWGAFRIMDYGCTTKNSGSTKAMKQPHDKKERLESRRGMFKAGSGARMKKKVTEHVDKGPGKMICTARFSNSRLTCVYKTNKY